jgi:large subunit ribosomal protein L28
MSKWGCQQVSFYPISIFYPFRRNSSGGHVARCELTGKSPVVKNLVSHSNIKTKFMAFPNIQKKRLFSNALGEFVTLKVATSAIKSLEHSGGFDKFILNLPESVMSPRALTVMRKIARKIKSKNKAKA